MKIIQQSETRKLTDLFPLKSSRLLMKYRQNSQKIMAASVYCRETSEFVGFSSMRGKEIKKCAGMCKKFREVWYVMRNVGSTVHTLTLTRHFIQSEIHDAT